MLTAKLKTYLLVGAIEPEHDIAAANALVALQSAECVVALSPYASAKAYAQVILPIGSFAETSGTYINVEGRWQSVPGAAKPVGESRPAWKVLRVLGNLLNLPGFEYVSSEQVRDELKKQLASISADARPLTSLGERATPLAAIRSPSGVEGNTIDRDVPMYSVDAVVRRSTPLQLTADALHAKEGRA
jgi:NADH-quinone oxidoreductase subunit G